MSPQIDLLKSLRAPFPPNQISRLPKPTKAQTDAVRNDFKSGIRCDICGQWHHPKVVHLDYVGHAALTSRLLDIDPLWSWEPLAVDEVGLPALDRDGGLWIKLTVAGMARIGYGDAPGKMGGDATKERIGDALRNASMRFGCALDLWHKGDLYAHEDDDASGAVGGQDNKVKATPQPVQNQPSQNQIDLQRAIKTHQASIKAIRDGIASGDLSSASEAWFELTDIEKQSLWAAPSKGGPFSTKERETMKTSDFRLANQQSEPADGQAAGMFQGA